MSGVGKAIGRRTAAAALGLLVLLLSGPARIDAAGGAGDESRIEIRVDEEAVALDDPVYVREGRTFVPAAPIARELGAKAVWDGELEELTIQTRLGDTIVLGNGVPVVYFNEGRYVLEKPPFLKKGRLYAPLRQLTQLLHAELAVRDSGDVLELTEVQPAVVTAAYGLEQISRETGVAEETLLQRNGLTAESAPAPGTELKVVVPSVFAHPAEPYTESEYLLLAKITMVEAGYEGYEGQLAIANVILNRVKDRRFPDTIRDVIYSGKQFPPAHNGLLDKSKPNASVLRAAKDALNGKNNVEDAVYFYNPAVTKGAFWSGLDTVTTIGHHRFAK